MAIHDGSKPVVIEDDKSEDLGDDSDEDSEDLVDDMTDNTNDDTPDIPPFPDISDERILTEASDIFTEDSFPSKTQPHLEKPSAKKDVNPITTLAPKEAKTPIVATVVKDSNKDSRFIFHSDCIVPIFTGIIGKRWFVTYKNDPNVVIDRIEAFENRIELNWTMHPHEDVRGSTRNGIYRCEVTEKTSHEVEIPIPGDEYGKYKGMDTLIPSQKLDVEHAVYQASKNDWRTFVYTFAK